MEAAKDQAKAAFEDLQDRRRREAKEAEPEFISQGGNISGAQIETNIGNRGGEARDIELHYDGPHEFEFSPMGLLESHGKATFTLRQKRGQPLEFPIRFFI